MEDKIGVFYVHCGEGHKKAAQAIEEFLDTQSWDLLDFANPFFSFFYRYGYYFITEKFPFLWKVIFNVFRISIFRLAVNILHLIIFKKFLLFLTKERFEVVISTHFFAPFLVGWIKKRRNIKNAVVITDLGVHPFWIEKTTDVYFVGLDRTKSYLKRWIDEKKIVVSGIPIRKGFIEEKEFPEVEKKPLILFLSSSRGFFPFLRKTLELLKEDFRIVIIYGENRDLREKFKDFGPSVRLIYYMEDIWKIMKEASIIVTKPGGLTTFESIFLKKPMVFTHCIPGQEEENLRIITAMGIGFVANTPFQLKELIEYILNNYDHIRSKFPSLTNPADIIKKWLKDNLQ